MNALRAEFALAWKRATRGPLLWALLLTVALTLGLLPGRDDPDLVYTGYGTCLAWAILLVAALWSGASAYALDRDRHLLTLPLTKPLHRWGLWWCRTLNVWLPFAVATLALFGALLWRPLPEGRAQQLPILPELRPQAVAELQRLREAGSVPEGFSEARLLRAVEKAIANRYEEVTPTGSLTLNFPGLAAEATLCQGAIRLSGAPFYGARSAIQLCIRVTCDGETAELHPDHLLERGVTVPLPEGLLRPGKPVTVTLSRHDTATAGTVLLRPRADLQLLIPGATSHENLAAFILPVLFTLLMAVALGTALGASLSFPVALFTGALALLSVSFASLTAEPTVYEESASLWTRLSAEVSWYLFAPFSSLFALNPVGKLFEGEQIPWATLGRMFTHLVFPWLLVCSLPAWLTSVKDQDL